MVIHDLDAEGKPLAFRLMKPEADVHKSFAGEVNVWTDISQAQSSLSRAVTGVYLSSSVHTTWWNCKF